MFRNRNQVVLPLEIGRNIAKDDPVFKSAEICDKLDYSRLEKEYVRAWRKLNPATMFILLVYAYMRRLYSSRQIEEACKTDIRFMWILGHEPAPDHSTIARFQNEKLVPVIENLFYQIIEQLIDMNEVYYTNMFVDGTKIEANANKYSFVWAKAVEKNLKKLETKTISTDLSTWNMTKKQMSISVRTKKAELFLHKQVHNRKRLCHKQKSISM